MPIGDDITEPLPTVGSAGTAYATLLKAFLDEVEARLEANIPLSALQIATLDMVNNAIQNLSYAGLYEGAEAPTTPTGSLQRYQDNLYWIGASGAVRITDGAQLDFGSAGSITGDYGGSDPARFKFVGADQTYYAYDDESLGTWARVFARSFDIAAGASGATRVRLAYGGAGSYTLTLPAALPADTSIVQMDATGQLTASNTIVNDVTMTTDKDITLVGTGQINHGTYTKSCSLIGYPRSSTTVAAFAATPTLRTVVAAGTDVFFPLDVGLKSGDRLLSITITGSLPVGGTNPTFFIYHDEFPSGLTQIRAATADGLTQLYPDEAVTYNVDTPFDVGDGRIYLHMHTGTDETHFYRAIIRYDHV